MNTPSQVASVSKFRVYIFSAAMMFAPFLALYFWLPDKSITSKYDVFFYILFFVFYVVSVVILSLVVLYPSFSQSTKRKVWFFSTIFSSLVVGALWFLPPYFASLSSSGWGVLLAFVVGAYIAVPISIVVIYAIFAGRILRLFMYKKLGRVLGFILTILVFISPFAVILYGDDVLRLVLKGMVWLADKL